MTQLMIKNTWLSAVALSVLICGSAQATPIVYEGTLADGIGSIGTVSTSGSYYSPSSSLSDYWTFFGNFGDTVTIEVQRLEAALDPALWIFEGVIADDSVFDGAIGFGDPGFLAFADDELSDPGPFGDPLASVTLTLPGTGQYTAIVTNFASGADDGDGLFPYEITAANIVNVPEPMSLALLGLGLAGIGFSRRR